MTKEPARAPHFAHKPQDNKTVLLVLAITFVLAIAVFVALAQRNRVVAVSPLGRARYAYEYTPESGSSKLGDLLARDYITRQFYQAETQSFESLMECGPYADLSYVYGPETITGNTATVPITMNGDAKRQATTHWIKSAQGWALDSVSCTLRAPSNH